MEFLLVGLLSLNFEYTSFCIRYFGANDEFSFFVCMLFCVWNDIV